MRGVTYDAGALVAAERNDRRMWALHAGFLEEEIAPTVPAPVLAQVWRGGSKQASLSRLLALCQVEPMTEEQARAVGRLADRSRHKDVVDLAVVEGALRRKDAIVTSDLQDIGRIVVSTGQHVPIESV
jgi:predicted nucleic acid-binding protein